MRDRSGAPPPGSRAVPRIERTRPGIHDRRRSRSELWSSPDAPTSAAVPFPERAALPRCPALDRRGHSLGAGLSGAPPSAAEAFPELRGAATLAPPAPPRVGRGCSGTVARVVLWSLIAVGALRGLLPPSVDLIPWAAVAYEGGHAATPGGSQDERRAGASGRAQDERRTAAWATRGGTATRAPRRAAQETIPGWWRWRWRSCASTSPSVRTNRRGLSDSVSTAWPAPTCGGRSRFPGCLPVRRPRGGGWRQVGRGRSRDHRARPRPPAPLGRVPRRGDTGVRRAGGRPAGRGRGHGPAASHLLPIGSGLSRSRPGTAPANLSPTAGRLARQAVVAFVNGDRATLTRLGGGRAPATRPLPSGWRPMSIGTAGVAGPPRRARGHLGGRFARSGSRRWSRSVSGRRRVLSATSCRWSSGSTPALVGSPFARSRLAGRHEPSQPGPRAEPAPQRSRPRHPSRSAAAGATTCTGPPDPDRPPVTTMTPHLIPDGRIPSGRIRDGPATWSGPVTLPRLRRVGWATRRAGPPRWPVSPAQVPPDHAAVGDSVPPGPSSPGQGRHALRGNVPAGTPTRSLDRRRYPHGRPRSRSRSSDQRIPTAKQRPTEPARGLWDGSEGRRRRWCCSGSRSGEVAGEDRRGGDGGRGGSGDPTPSPESTR